MTVDTQRLAMTFFAAARTLARHPGTVQERLADTYADHLLQVVARDLPPELQPSFRDLEAQMSAGDEDEADDPFRAAAQRLTDAEAQDLIDHIVALFGHLAGLRPG